MTITLLLSDDEVHLSLRHGVQPMVNGSQHEITCAAKSVRLSVLEIHLGRRKGGTLRILYHVLNKHIEEYVDGSGLSPSCSYRKSRKMIQTHFVNTIEFNVSSLTIRLMVLPDYDNQGIVCFGYPVSVITFQFNK